MNFTWRKTKFRWKNFWRKNILTEKCFPVKFVVYINVSKTYFMICTNGKLRYWKTILLKFHFLFLLQCFFDKSPSKNVQILLPREFVLIFFILYLDEHLLRVNRFHLMKFLFWPIAPFFSFWSRSVSSENRFNWGFNQNVAHRISICNILIVKIYRFITSCFWVAAQIYLIIYI